MWHFEAFRRGFLPKTSNIRPFPAKTHKQDAKRKSIAAKSTKSELLLKCAPLGR
jgi:hypothetical protein